MPGKKSPPSTRRVHLDTPDDALNPATVKTPPAPKAERHDPEAEQRRQQAYDAEFSWRGEPLHGFSVSRDAIFGQLRLAMGAPPLSRCLADPEAFQADAQRILFLCSHEPIVWNRLRADMANLQTAVDEWAERHITRDETLLAETLAMRIWLAAQENRHEPAPVQSSNADDEGN